MDSIPALPTDPKRIPVPGFGVFVRTSLASTKVETDLCCLMGCYSLDSSITPNPSATVQLAAMKNRTRGYSIN